MAWFGNGLGRGVGIDPGLLKPKPKAVSSFPLDPGFQPEPTPTYPSQPLDRGLTVPPVSPIPPTILDSSIGREIWKKKQQRDRLWEQRVAANQAAYDAGPTPPIPPAQLKPLFSSQSSTSRFYYDNYGVKRWRPIDQFETGKDAIDQEYATRYIEGEGDYFRRTGEGQEGSRSRISRDEFESGKTELDLEYREKMKQGVKTPSFYYDRSGVKRLYYLPVKPTSRTKPIFSIDPGLSRNLPVSTPGTPTVPAPATPLRSQPSGLFRLLPEDTLPNTQVSLLEAKEHLNVVKPAEDRPRPSYLTTAEYDNPGKRNPFDSPGWRLQDRIVALAPFNRPNNDWNDPGEAVKASAKFRKALIDTDYSEKRRRYIDAKSRKENQEATLVSIRKNIKDLENAGGLSGKSSWRSKFGGLGTHEHTTTEDLIDYWKKEESTAAAELVKTNAAFSTAKTAEMNAGREVKDARNKMNKYLMRGPYTKDTRATIGGLFGMALGGLIVFNLIVPTSFKKKTRNLNPLYSVFA